MERCNARTMEIYRRMGLAAKIRAAGLPRDVPMDVYIVQRVTEAPLLHLPYPSVAEARREIDACTTTARSRSSPTSSSRSTRSSRCSRPWRRHCRA